MSAATREHEAAQLVRLAERRERRALERVAEARAELARLEGVLAEQLALIEGMHRSIRELDETRTRTGSVAADVLRLESTRRRWLVFDVEGEEFYVDAMEEDVAGARETLAAHLGEWRAAGARRERLERLLGEERRRAGRHVARREERALDDRPFVVGEDDGVFATPLQRPEALSGARASPSRLRGPGGR